MNKNVRYVLDYRGLQLPQYAGYPPACQAAAAAADCFEQSLSQGVQLHKAGKLDAAEQRYRLFLRSEPSHADCLHQLGALLVQKGGSKQVCYSRMLHYNCRTGTPCSMEQ